MDIEIGPALTDYPSVPRIIGVLVSSGKATLHELETVYGVEDAYDMLEVILVDAQNEKTINKFRAAQNK